MLNIIGGRLISDEEVILRYSRVHWRVARVEPSDNKPFHLTSASLPAVARSAAGERRRYAALFTVDTYTDHEFEGRVTAVYPKAEIRDNVVNYVTAVRFGPLTRLLCGALTGDQDRRP